MKKIPAVPRSFAAAATQQVNGLEAAAQALQRKAPAEAERVLISVLALAPQNADALRLLGISQHLQRNYKAAAATLREALSARPDDALILNNLGSALRGCGDVDGAVAAFRRATELAPSMPAPWYNLGKALKNNTYPEQARAAFERALQCDPEYAQAWVPLGDVLKAVGNVETAVSCYRTALRYPDQAPRAWFHLSNLKTIHLSADDATRLQVIFENPALSDEQRVFAGYALAKALEDQHDYAAAFQALRRTNELKRRKVPWNAGLFSAKINAIETAFARPMARAPDPSLGHQVIFIVSLPRSGSTLTEQILASHPQVEGANELQDLPSVLNEESRRRGREFPEWVNEATADDWHRLGLQYMQRTSRWHHEKPRFTDKGLSNWQFIGAAAAMLPAARFVNCRRDPVETCVSCYRQYFSRGNYFSYDLKELGSYWRDYDRLGRAWQAIFPDRVFEQVYEQLLADPEAQIRRLLEFLDLPFDPACLQFHRSKRVVRTASAAQVRQPLRRDTARANRYGNALDPLREALGLE
jgi:cytochrome c-type biogenesis protein CcmH/NrfG